MALIDTYQSLVGTLVALLAAFVGFLGVIYSQRKLSQMAEAGRKHEADLREEEEARATRSQLIALKSAFSGEMSALSQALTQAMRLLDAQIEITQRMLEARPDTVTRPMIGFRFSTPVFASHVGRIGLLGPELTYPFAKFYGGLASLDLYSKEAVPEIDARTAIAVMGSVKGNLAVLLQDVDALQSLIK